MSQPHPLLEAVRAKVSSVSDLLIGEAPDGHTQKLERALDEHDADSLLQLVNRNAKLHEELEQIQSRVDSLETLVHAQGKRGKVAAIIKYAKQKGSSGDQGVMLSPKEIRGATGVSRRYSYQIIEDWPDEFGFFLRRENLSQYGDLELSTESDGPRLVVVFDGTVHSRVTSVNKFNTGIAVEGGSA
jgi:hypothetical protein